MYRVCLQGAEPVELQCDTLEQACEAVRAKFGDFEVLPGADEQFWLCCQNINESDSEVVARIYLEAPTTDELERPPVSGERSTPSSEGDVLSRRTPTGS